MMLCAYKIWCFNEASNSNDTTHVVNNLCLITMGAQQFSMAAIQLTSCRKVNLSEMRDNDTKPINIHTEQTEINFTWERMGAMCPVVQAVGQLVWAGRETKIFANPQL